MKIYRNYKKILQQLKRSALSRSKIKRNKSLLQGQGQFQYKNHLIQEKGQLHPEKDQLHQEKDQLHQGTGQLHQGTGQLRQGTGQLRHEKNQLHPEINQLIQEKGQYNIQIKPQDQSTRIIQAKKKK